MADYYEIIFEEVNNATVNEFVDFLLSRAVSVYKVEDVGGENIKNEMISYNFPGKSDDFLVMCEFVVGASTLIPLAFLRIFRYEGKIDIEISFDASDIKWVNRVMCSAKEFSKELPRKFGIKNIYGGMEPASDEDTRYFTNDEFGPLFQNT